MAVLRNAPRTPVRQSLVDGVEAHSEASLAPETSSSIHKKFEEGEILPHQYSDDSDLVEDSIVVEVETDSDEDQIEEEGEEEEKPEEEDSDEAPEEQSLSVSAEQTKSKLRETEKLLREANAAEKDKRRKRDTVLKEQKAKSSSKLLPQHIFDELEREKQTPRLIKVASKHKRLDTIITASGTTNKLPKTLYRKGPVVVRVLKRASKLAPVKESIISMTRDQFLNRKSVLRR